jgi:hypothetical protein
MNFNSRTHAIALTIMGGSAYAANWFLHHNAQLVALAQVIANHPVGSLSAIAVPLIMALYNPSK